LGRNLGRKNGASVCKTDVLFQKLGYLESIRRFLEFLAVRVPQAGVFAVPFHAARFHIFSAVFDMDAG